MAGQHHTISAMISSSSSNCHRYFRQNIQFGNFVSRLLTPNYVNCQSFGWISRNNDYFFLSFLQTDKTISFCLLKVCIDLSLIPCQRLQLLDRDLREKNHKSRSQFCGKFDSFFVSELSTFSVKLSSILSILWDLCHCDNLSFKTRAADKCLISDIFRTLPKWENCQHHLHHSRPHQPHHHHHHDRAPYRSWARHC